MRWFDKQKARAKRAGSVLRVESLEARRLFVADLALASLGACPPFVSAEVSSNPHDHDQADAHDDDHDHAHDHGSGSGVLSFAEIQAKGLKDSPKLLSEVAPNVILSSRVPSGLPLIQNAPGDPLPAGNQFYLAFRLNWQGAERDEFQVLAKLANRTSDPNNQILLWQLYQTDQVQLLVTVNGVERNVVVPWVMVNGTRDWVVQVTNDGRAQLYIDGALRGEMNVGNISSIPRDTLQLGKNEFGFGSQVWGEYQSVRADVDGDAREDVVVVPPPRMPRPYTPKPIPNLPNPNPSGFLNTAQLSNAERIRLVLPNFNSAINSLASDYAWRGDVIAFAFNVQDIDNNAIADFDEGGWRTFYTDVLLKNVTQLTGLQFWERPEGVGTIQFHLTPGGGGSSGMPEPMAAPDTGTKVGITGPVAAAGRFTGSIRITQNWFHELGHALGLDHPFNTFDGLDTGLGQGLDSVPRRGDHFLNSKLYVTMGYSPKTWGEDNPFTPEVDFGTDLGERLPQSTFLPFDIAALHHLYGMNTSSALGDDIYSFNDLTTASRGLRTIWDNGGNDTIRYTGTRRAVINLNDATLQKEVGGGGFLSTSEALETGFLIANGVVIENAIGGNQQDFITGNEANNRLAGNGGDDVIRGEAGDDTLVGSLGNDYLDGGPGFDTVELAGLRSEYTLTPQLDGSVFVRRTTGELDILRDVEQVRFRSGAVTAIADLLPSGMSFYATARARFDNLSGGQWQRVFDFGNGPERDNIYLGQMANTNTMRFAFVSAGTWYFLDAPARLVNGQVAQWTAQVTEGGLMQLYKNGTLVAQRQAVAVPKVARTGLLVGDSHWPWDTDLIGTVDSLTADIDGDRRVDLAI